MRWLAFYGATADESVLAIYDIVVLDSAFQGSISRVADAGARVCGYLSLGEIRTSDSLLMYLDPAALLPENPDWPGTRRVDIRDPSWRSLVIDRRLPSLVSQGFTGVMLDTLDTPPYLEQLDPVRYRGMREAAIALVCVIVDRAIHVAVGVIEPARARQILNSGVSEVPLTGDRGLVAGGLKRLRHEMF